MPCLWRPLFAPQLPAQQCGCLMLRASLRSIMLPVVYRRLPQILSLKLNMLLLLLSFVADGIVDDEGIFREKTLCAA